MSSPFNPQTMSGLDPTFSAAIMDLYNDAPEDIRNQLSLISGYRSVDHQARLYENALKKYGSPEAARKWVAPPGNSRHNYGLAVDFGYGTPAAKEYVHNVAQNYGLHFPMSWEDWHIEPIGADGGRVPLGNSGYTPQITNTAANTSQAAPQPAKLPGPARGRLAPPPTQVAPQAAPMTPQDRMRLVGENLMAMDAGMEAPEMTEQQIAAMKEIFDRLGKTKLAKKTGLFL